MKPNKLSASALFCAITLIATSAFQIPSGLNGGYMNVGDVFVLLSAYLLGPANGAVAAALGAFFADIFTGHTIFALPTFAIKFFSALTAGIIFKSWHRKKFFRLILCGSAGELIMILGYFLVDFVLSKNILTALTGIYGNFIQAIFAVLVSAIFYKAIMDDKKLRRYFRNL